MDFTTKDTNYCAGGTLLLRWWHFVVALVAQCEPVGHDVVGERCGTTSRVVSKISIGRCGGHGPKKQMLHPGKDEFDGLVDEFEDKVQYLGVPGRLRDFGEALMSTFQSGRASRARFPA